MDASDKLKQMAVLGHVVDNEEKAQAVDLRKINPIKMSLAATQLEAAHICVQKAIDIIEEVPITSNWMGLFALRMMCLQLINYSKQLEGR